MSTLNLDVYVLGSGRAAAAMVESLKIVELMNPRIRLHSLGYLKREDSFGELTLSKSHSSLLLIANPHALHADAILNAERVGFDLVVCEKPAAVSLEQIEQLKGVKVPVAICHGYRQQWGIQALKEDLMRESFGAVIAIEGRYWQSSAASTHVNQSHKPNWKNDPTVAGFYDVLVDIAPHWLDVACFLLNDRDPLSTQISKSFVNAESAHRDTHVWLNFDFQNKNVQKKEPPDKVKVMASVSKTTHGFGNHFEVNVLGSDKMATWNFLSPDVIHYGVGADVRIKARTSEEFSGSLRSPFHGLGWLEGYVSILQESLSEVFFEPTKKSYPKLNDHLAVMKLLLKGS